MVGISIVLVSSLSEAAESHLGVFRLYINDGYSMTYFSLDRPRSSGLEYNLSNRTPHVRNIVTLNLGFSDLT